MRLPDSAAVGPDLPDDSPPPPRNFHLFNSHSNGERGGKLPNPHLSHVNRGRGRLLGGSIVLVVDVPHRHCSRTFGPHRVHELRIVLLKIIDSRCATVQ